MTAEIIERVLQSRRMTEIETASWDGVCSLLQILDVIAKEGATVVVKLDGERTDDRYTVIVSGGPLGADFYRGDGDDLSKLLEAGIGHYDAKVWRLTSKT